MTFAQLHLVVKALKLSEVERSFLEAMLLKERAKQNSERAVYAKRISRAKKNVRIDNVLISERGLIADIYTLPTLVYLTDFLENSHPVSDTEVVLLAKKFGVEKSKISSAVLTLLRAGTAQRHADTRPAREVHYVFNKLNNVHSQKNYLRAWLREAEKKIDSEYASDDSFFNASTISISFSNIAAMREELKAVIDKYMSMPVNELHDKTIVQTCIQIFPLLVPDEPVTTRD